MKPAVQTDEHTTDHRTRDGQLRHDHGRDERDAPGDQLLERLGPEGKPVGEHQPACAGCDVDDADQGLVWDALVARSRDREDHRADRCECERVQRDGERVALVVVAHEDRPHHAEGRDLGEREVDEDDLALDDMHAEVDQHAGHGEARQQRQPVDVDQL